MRPRSIVVTAALLGASAFVVYAQQPTTTNLGSDANGNPSTSDRDDRAISGRWRWSRGPVSQAGPPP
ncbi:MAG: hypothetical protein AUH43_01365 [Acidobacteria bacterium 13_1_40CM_65_14]|nr:MAG: hypothetical protein AUH43_01365 [Acidobacteria bacterium 13_1_40CM_65_14]OLD17734.1 MAG: hypothetical protein AUJ01_08545 [Acidobacteria bacterium 13_1_40CM_3_65_5]OLE84135.1 MAG: hypothetical protein AUF76_04275 [Acidobacteria bacterium 13_1_20CM_2_65_9]